MTAATEHLQPSYVTHRTERVRDVWLVIACAALAGALAEFFAIGDRSDRSAVFV